MNVTIKGTNYEVDAKARELIDNKLKPIERTLGADAEKALVEVEIELVEERKNNNAVYRAEINISVEGKLYRGASTRRLLQNAMNDVKEELTKEIRRSRGKERDMTKKGGRLIKSFLRGFGGK